MLNYIWLALVVIGIGVAVWSDVHDLSTNKYHNGEYLQASIQNSPSADSLSSRLESYPITLVIVPADFNSMYGTNIADMIRFTAEIFPTKRRSDEPDTYLPEFGGILHIIVNDRTPSIWKEIYKLQKNQDFLLARYIELLRDPRNHRIKLTLDPVKFVKLNAVTNDGIIKYAKTAVELAIALIGIMALWLGIMKIGEQSGLVSKLGSLLKPITTRLFPDVPADHPAMGAMIMNISANMLGLMNAATPLGLKAMEELNKLNKKGGTATDAMCTFLVINTSNVQLIPATVIAIRAAAGSASPTEILGPVIVATIITLIVGVTTAKLMAMLPMYKRQLTGLE